MWIGRSSSKEGPTFKIIFHVGANFGTDCQFQSNCQLWGQLWGQLSSSFARCYFPLSRGGTNHSSGAHYPASMDFFFHISLRYDLPSILNDPGAAICQVMKKIALQLLMALACDLHCHQQLKPFTPLLSCAKMSLALEVGKQAAW